MANLDITTATPEEKAGIRAALDVPTNSEAEITQQKVEDAIEDPANFREVVMADPGKTYVVISGVGIDYTGVSDSTAAVQDLLNSSVADGIYQFKFLAGTVKCNITLPQFCSIEGAGPIFPAAWGAGTTGPTVLVPADDAEPVILMTEVFGQEIRNLYLMGNGEEVSACGIKLIRDGGATYAGNGLTMVKVGVAKFTKGYWNFGATMVTIDQCIFTRCGNIDPTVGTPLYLEPGGFGVSDTHTIRNTAIGANGELYTGIYVNGCKGLQLLNCELGNCGRLIYMTGAASVALRDCNVESVYGDELIYRVNGNLIWSGGSVGPFFGNVNASLVRSESNNGRVLLENVRSTFSESKVDFISGEPVIVGMYNWRIRNYSDNTWSTLRWSWTKDRPSIGLALGVDQAISPATYTTIQWNATRYGADSGIVNTSGVLTLPKQGRYRITASLRLSSITSYAAIRFRRENALQYTDCVLATTGAAGTTLQSSAVIEIDTPNTQSLQVQVVNGGACTVQGTAAPSCLCFVEWIGEL